MQNKKRLPIILLIFFNVISFCLIVYNSYQVNSINKRYSKLIETSNTQFYYLLSASINTSLTVNEFPKMLYQSDSFTKFEKSIKYVDSIININNRIYKDLLAITDDLKQREQIQKIMDFRAGFNKKRFLMLNLLKDNKMKEFESIYTNDFFNDLDYYDKLRLDYLQVLKNHANNFAKEITLVSDVVNRINRIFIWVQVIFIGLIITISIFLYFIINRLNDEISN